MDKSGNNKFPKQTLSDIATIIKHFETGSPAARSCLEAVIPAILSDLSRFTSEDVSELSSPLKTLHLLLQVYVDQESKSKEVSPDVAVKSLDISSSFLQKFTAFDATANTFCYIIHLSLLLLSTADLDNNVKAIVAKCEEALSVYIASETQQVDNFHPQIAVQLLSAVLDALCMNAVFHTSKSGPLSDQNNFRISNELVAHLSLCNNDALRSQTLLVLVPKILKWEGENVILQKILDAIFVCQSEEYLCKALAALSALSSYYFPDGDNNVTLPIEGENAFWVLVQQGLCSDSSLCRKHALYLVRKCVSSLLKRQVDVNCDMFSWVANQPEKNICLWQDICTILEVLEERAFYLVSPGLNKLQIIFSHVNEYFAPTCVLSWCLTVFKRVLKHSCIHVVRWGVTILISELGCDLISSKHARIFNQFFLDTLIHNLNSPPIYYEIEDDESEYDEEVTKSLEKFFVSAAKSEIRQETFLKLFDVMGTFNWSPVPLYIFTKSLTKVPSFKCLNPEDTPTIKRFVSKIITAQNVSIRLVCLQHLLVAVINLTNSDNIDLKAVLDVLTAIYFDGILPRKSELWNNMVAWISETFKESEIDPWLTEYATCSDYFPPVLAQLVTLLFDAGLLKNCDLLENLLSLLSDCDTRLYIDQEHQTRCVEFVAHLVRASKIIELYNEQSFDKTREAVLYIVKVTASNITLLFKMRLLFVDNLSAYNRAARLLKCFGYFCEDEEIVLLLSKEKTFIKLVSAAVDLIQNECSPNSINLAFAMKMVKFWYENQYQTSNIQLLERISQVFTKFFQQIIGVEPSCSQICELPCWVAELQGSVASFVLEAQWEFVYLYITTSNCTGMGDVSEWMLESISVGLDLGGRTILLILLNVLGEVLSKFTLSDNPAMLAVLRHCWSSVVEVRHKDAFYPALRRFLNAILQPNFVMTPSGKKFASECGQELFSWGDSAIGVVAELAYALQTLVHRSPEVVLHAPIRSLLVSCFVMSSIQRRDQKLLRKITCLITDEESSNSSLRLMRDDPFAFVRCTAVEIFLFLMSGDDIRTTETADHLTRDLIAETETPEAKRARYFSNSVTHRIQLHVLQGLLLVESKTSLEMKKTLGEWLVKRLLGENHQLSVRYLTEWLLVRISCSVEKFRSDLLKLVETVDIRESALCSVISTLLHYCQSLHYVARNKVEDRRNFLSQFFKALLPLTMSQAYSVRFNAHVAILQVWNIFEKLQLTPEIQLYKMSAEAVQNSFTRASNKFQNHKDFYLTEFKCVEHYSLETIFYDLPRLTHMSEDECLKTTLVKTTGIVGPGPMPWTNADRRLSEWHCAINRKRGANSSSNFVANLSCVQKKMVPLKWREINELQLKSLPEVLRPWKIEDGDSPYGGLVVVASLLDKASNLGGLSRTCEIMGVSLVLPKMSFASDREFQALSMSSEMWTSLSEVKPHKLPEWLAEMKERGFTLVGAEQTGNSTPLNSVIFAENTILLLGNESEGIPSNLLPLLDVCVEIPQFGLVRSLNVHVAGALFIYEYRKQFCVPNLTAAQGFLG